MTNRKLITGFPTSYRWMEYVRCPQVPQRVTKRDLKIKFNFN